MMRLAQLRSVRKYSFIENMLKGTLQFSKTKDKTIIGKRISRLLYKSCNKNILRIFQAHFCEKVKNTEARRKSSEESV
jgi:hypothetical protein